MKKAPIFIVLVFAIGSIILGFVGMFKSKDVEYEKPVVEPEDKPVVEDYDVDKLYNYVKGFSYQYISLDEYNPSYIYSDLHQSYYINVDMLSNESILRSAIKQLVTCDGIYTNQTIPYNVVVAKAKEIVGRDIQFDTVYLSMIMGESESGYTCDINGCMPVGGAYCSNMPLTSDHTMVSHKIENDNVIIIDKDSKDNSYTHTFTKDTNGNYYWVSSEGTELQNW